MGSEHAPRVNAKLSSKLQSRPCLTNLEFRTRDESSGKSPPLDGTRTLLAATWSRITTTTPHWRRPMALTRVQESVFFLQPLSNVSVSTRIRQREVKPNRSALRSGPQVSRQAGGSSTGPAHVGAVTALNLQAAASSRRSQLRKPVSLFASFYYTGLIDRFVQPYIYHLCQGYIILSKFDRDYNP